MLEKNVKKLTELLTCSFLVTDAALKVGSFSVVKLSKLLCRKLKPNPSFLTPIFAISPASLV